MTGDIAGALDELGDLWRKVHHISVDRRPYQAFMAGIKQCLVNGLNFGHADATIQRNEFLFRNHLMQCTPQSRICVAATQRCEAQLRGVDWWEQSTRRGHQPFIELKDGRAVPNLCADGARLGVVEAHRGDRGQEGVHILRTDAEAISVLTVHAHLVRFQPHHAAQLMFF